jgi:hypothetical protein
MRRNNMAGYNVSLYLDNERTWKMFKEACTKEGRRPESVIRTFVDQYSREALGIESDLELQIARAMIETKKINQGLIKAKEASVFLDEL